MFIKLLVVTFLISVGVSALVAQVFKRPIEGVLRRIIADEISSAWVRYMKFAIYVVGISKGVRIWDLERYISSEEEVEEGFESMQQKLPLNPERWVMEIYQTINEAMQGIALMLLVFFAFALLAYVVVRLAESRRT